MTSSHDAINTLPLVSDQSADTDVHTPTHALMPAPCRMGKSVGVHVAFSNLLDRGGAVFILDPYGAYREESHEAVS